MCELMISFFHFFSRKFFGLAWDDRICESWSRYNSCHHLGLFQGDLHISPAIKSHLRNLVYHIKWAIEDNSNKIQCLIEGVVSSINDRGQLLCKTTATEVMMAHQQVVCLASEDTISGTAKTCRLKISPNYYRKMWKIKYDDCILGQRSKALAGFCPYQDILQGTSCTFVVCVD